MKPVPKSIHFLVKNFRILLSEKARHQLDTSPFDTDDLIESILLGSLMKKEKDETKRTKYKYTIIGPSRSGTSIYSCGKEVNLGEKKYFIITFHKAR